MDYPTMQGIINPQLLFSQGSFTPQYSNKEVVNVIMGCEANCANMLNILNASPFVVQERVTQINLLRECRDICGVTANFIASNAIFQKDAARLCSAICLACGRECSRFSDIESQNCARVCLYCAETCRRFSEM